MEGEKNKILIWGVGLVALVALVMVLMAGGDAEESENVNVSEGEVDNNLSSGVISLDVDASTKIPGVDEGDEETAAPAHISDMGDGAREGRFFLIEGKDGSFGISKIVVGEGDLVNIRIKGVDGKYDLTIPAYGLKQTVEEGQEKIMEFQAVNPGKYLFYCESCGGAQSGAAGELVVVPKE